MEAIHSTIDIRASAERVFSYLEDPSNDIEWLPSMMSVQNINGYGSRRTYRWTYRMAGFELEGDAEVIEHVPSELLVLHTKGGAESTWKFLFRSLDPGTRLDLTIEYSVPLPVLGKLAEKLIVRRNRREIQVAMENIRDFCEG